MAFFTIFIPTGLSDSQYELALRSGPGVVSSRRRDHGEMLESAGFRVLEATDLTRDFLQTAQAWFHGRTRYAAELSAAEGEASFEERQRDAAAQITAIEAGVLKRALFVCD